MFRTTCSSYRKVLKYSAFPYKYRIFSNMTIDTSSRLQSLRDRMKLPENNVQAYLVPSEDAHQSEYPSDHDQRRAFISGFTGSFGTAVVTTDNAALWTDGRYFLQASIELSGEWTLMKHGLPETPKRHEWLFKVLPPNSRVAVDPKLISIEVGQKLEKELQEGNLSLVYLKDNLIDQVWQEQPSRPKTPVHALSIEYTGRSVADKIAALRESLKTKNTFGFLVSALDEVAWLLNLRGADVECNPTFYAYVVVTLDQVILFVQPYKIPSDIQQSLVKEANVTFKEYNEIFNYLETLKENISKEKKKFQLSKDSNIALLKSIGAENAVILSSPIELEKALKNPVELENMRIAHLKDAAALCEFFYWLEEAICRKETITEAQAAEKLLNFRQMQPDFVEPSFPTIAGYGPNGAIIHYRPQPGKCAQIGSDNLFLLDSGGQYKNGTTDVTRTVHFGQPSDYQKHCFTRVLQGHIDLDMAVFPKGTHGHTLDALARAPLWKDGLDYRHGTGHGVGVYLNVHEGPQRISMVYNASNDVAFQPGMTVTDEPGYYEDGQFGIRIENVMIVKNMDTMKQFGDKPYFGFEHITLVPIQLKMIKTSLLTEEQLNWINAYHKECLDKVSKYLLPNSKGLEWLKKATVHLSR